jgi:epoxyqueuosine reductase
MHAEDIPNHSDDRRIMQAAIERALALGASVAGFVPARLLRDCPSARAEGYRGWETFTGSVIVLGLHHDPAMPEMDYWEEGRSTPGDRMLRGMTTAIARWLSEEHGRAARDIPYQIDAGGIFLKDAAALAGLGCIGRNNLVIVPEFGPRVRFRALWADLEVNYSAPPFMPSPCEGCPRFCETACPQQALTGGQYSRQRCLRRMDEDKMQAAAQQRKSGHEQPVDHCRTCDLVCPAGTVSGKKKNTRR